MAIDISKLKALAERNKEVIDVSDSAAAKVEPPFVRTTDGRVKNQLQNAVIYIEYCLPDCIQFNEFTGRIEIRKPVLWDPDNNTVRHWTDTDTNYALMYANTYGLTNKANMTDAVDIVAKRNRYHPVKEYLESLEYKGDGYIRRLFVEYMGCEDTEYTFECVKLLLLAMIQRAYHPGCKFDYMPILVGAQGTYKSSMIRVLARDDAWFTDSVDSFSDRKRLAELIQGIWLVEVGEMSVFKKSEIESIKAAITSQVDSFREAYGHYKSDFNRTAIFVGTTNNKTFLKDSTGNRRFLILPIDEKKRTKDLFKSETRNEDFDGALAEALHIYKEYAKDGKMIPLVLPESVLAEAKDRQNNANFYDEWAGLIESWLDEQTEESIVFYTSALDVWCNCLNREKGTYTNKEAFRINQIIEQLPNWSRVNSVKIKRTTDSGHVYFKYHGRGYKYELPEDIPFE